VILREYADGDRMHIIKKHVYIFNASIFILKKTLRDCTKLLTKHVAPIFPFWLVVYSRRCKDVVGIASNGRMMRE
jgi:hypothetical protein